jgi:hypothetical protein
MAYSRPASTRLVLATLLTLPLIAVAQRQPSPHPANGFVAGRILVKFKDGIADDRAKDVVASLGARSANVIGRIGVHIVELPTGADESVFVQAFQGRPEVEFAQLDYLRSPAGIVAVNDPLAPSELLSNMNVPAAWSVSTGSSLVTIAVLDTGVDSSHADLWANLLPGWNLLAGNSDTSDTALHGTYTVSTAAAATNNGLGAAGVCWSCKVLPLKVSNDSGSAADSTVVAALQWLQTKHPEVHIALISYPETGSVAVTSAAQQFVNAGGIVIVPGGNDGLLLSTPDNPYMLTVGAVNSLDQLWSWSNTGPLIDLVAIGSTYGAAVGGGYAYSTGSSYSAAYVAGGAALVMAANSACTGQSVYNILKQTADPLGSPVPNNSFGWGIFDAANAVGLASTCGGVGLRPTVTGTTSAAATINTAFTYQITANNNPTSFAATNLPPGLSLNAATGFISGTPTVSGVMYTISISATNSAGTGSAPLILTINGSNMAPVITSPLFTVGSVNEAFYYETAATNNPTAFNATGLPSGLVVNTGVIYGTPTVSGTFTVTLSATNSGGTATATLSITIYPPPSVIPVISSAASATGTADAAFSYQITASNSPTSYDATGLPAGLGVNTATGLISGTPSASGTSGVTVSATNASGTGSATLSLTINPAAISKPAITSSLTATGTMNAAFSYQITASNSPNGFGATGLPSGVSVNASSGLISGTPTVSGTYSVSLSATNSGGIGTAPLSLTINPAGSVPTITSSTSASDMINTAFGYQITATNTPTSFGATGLPSGLGVNTSTGMISGTPAVSGAFSVSLSATNSTGTGTASLSLTINPAKPAITSSLAGTGTVNTAWSYQITASNSPTSFNATSLPAGLSVNTGTGLISGTPTAAGSFSVSLSAANAGGTGTATLSLTVNSNSGVPSITSSLTASGALNVAFSYQITATNSPTSYYANSFFLPGGLSINTSTGLISGTPTTAGTYIVGLSATNASGTGTASLTLTIGAGGSAPVITSATTASATVNAVFKYQIIATNTPTSYGATGLPTGLSVSSSTGLVSGTPSASGTFAVSLSAKNATGTGTATLNLTVNAVVSAPVITSATNAAGTVNKAFSYQITANNSPTSYGATGLPAGLSVNSSTGLISGTPVSSGTFNVGLSATNNAGTGTATLSLTIGSAGDTTPPTAPTNLTDPGVSSSQVSLTWGGATDNVGVAGYEVFRAQLTKGAKASKQIATSPTTGYTDTTVRSGVTYSYTVYAYDVAGNVSAASNTITVTVP